MFVMKDLAEGLLVSNVTWVESIKTGSLGGETAEFLWKGWEERRRRGNEAKKRKEEKIKEKKRTQKGYCATHHHGRVENDVFLDLLLKSLDAQEPGQVGQLPFIVSTLLDDSAGYEVLDVSQRVATLVFEQRVEFLACCLPQGRCEGAADDDHGSLMDCRSGSNRSQETSSSGFLLLFVVLLRNF